MPIRGKAHKLTLRHHQHRYQSSYCVADGLKLVSTWRCQPQCHIAFFNFAKYLSSKRIAALFVAACIFSGRSLLLARSASLDAKAADNAMPQPMPRRVSHTARLTRNLSGIFLVSILITQHGSILAPWGLPPRPFTVRACCRSTCL